MEPPVEPMELSAWFPETVPRPGHPVIVVYELKNGHYHLGIDTDARLWRYVNRTWHRIEGQREPGQPRNWFPDFWEPEKPDQC